VAEQTEYYGDHLQHLQLGKVRGPIESIVKQVSDLGVVLNPTSIASIRSGRFSGGEIGLFTACALAKQNEDPSKKNDLYLYLTELLVHFRTTQSRPPYRYTSRGLTEDIAAYLAISSSDIRAALNCMRADYLSVTAPNSDSDFCRIVEVFLKKHTEKNGNTTRVWKSFEHSWDGTQQGLYQFFKDNNEKRGLLGSFVPYESEYLHQHYAGRKKGVIPPISRFDHDVLSLIDTTITASGRIRTGIDQECAEILADDFPVRLSKPQLLTHMRALGFGNLQMKMRFYEKSDEPSIDDFI